MHPSVIRRLCRFMGTIALIMVSVGLTARPASLQARIHPLPTPDPASQDGTMASVPLQAVWSPNQPFSSSGVALGDINGDGLLDTVFSTDDAGLVLFLNKGGKPSVTPDWTVTLPKPPKDVAIGDMNGDGLLDVVAITLDGPIVIYRNQGGQLPTIPSWQSPRTHRAWSVALGDMDGDGDYDVVIACTNRNLIDSKAVMYRNIGGGALSPGPVWESADNLKAVYVALDDYDGDQDLDAVFATYDRNDRTHLYRNDGGTLTTVPVWEAEIAARATSVVWKNIDTDPYPELFVANEDAANRLYDNISGTLALTPTWTALHASETQDLAVGDIDGDQDMDLLTVNGNVGPSRGRLEVFLRDANTYNATADWASNEADKSYSLALGDMDNDGDLDVVRANIADPSRLYLNRQAPFAQDALWRPSDSTSARTMAWGDYDDDGNLDLALGTSQGVRVYHNEGSRLSATPSWQSATNLRVWDVAWADMNMDDDLDLMVTTTGGALMFANLNGTIAPNSTWHEDRYGSQYMSMAIADVDGDSDLDVAFGMQQQPVQILANRTVENIAVGEGPYTDTFPIHDAWTAPVGNLTVRNLSWGDVDRDGDMDLAVANDGQPAAVYRNDETISQPGEEARYQLTPFWQNSNYFDNTRDIAWADMNADGWSDLVVANYGQPNRIFLNTNGQLAAEPAWVSQENDPSNGLDACDVEGDGDLDLFVFNENAPTRLYLTNNRLLNTSAEWSSTEVGSGFAGACGDMDRDGDLDLGVAYLDTSIESPPGTPGLRSAVYRNPRFDQSQQGRVPQLVLKRPGGPDADGFSTVHILDTPTIPVSYTLRDTGAWRVDLALSRFGGGKWEPAVPTTTTQTLALEPGIHRYEWDLFRSGIMGQLDATTLRLTAYPDVRPHRHGVAGSYQHGAYTTTSFPFRVRGTTVQVQRDDQPGQQAAVTGAIVYHLPEGQEGGGQPIAPSPSSPPFRTNTQGYLQGQADLKPNDRLLALAPITSTTAYTLYYTNGTPTELGMTDWTINQPGTQVITVSAQHPLYVFNLTVALEWDASRDPGYLQRLRTELQQTSRHLYDFTNGQVALGKITVYQNGDRQEFADVVIHASNRLRPFASEGGIVLTPTVDPQIPTITYYTGQVHIGADWSRYGDAGNNIDQDWSLILAHELSHYLFYMEDTYLGLGVNELLSPVSTCIGSAMGDVYAAGNTEFIADPDRWQTGCGMTLAAQELQRTEWETLRLWYPALQAPTATLSGPTEMPYAFTTITIAAPVSPTAAIIDPMVYLTYADAAENSAAARAYLIKPTNAIVPLGSPIAAQGQILARGGATGDRFCLFDGPRRHYGCEVLTSSGQYIELRNDPSWTPLVQLSPVTTKTTQLSVHGLQPGLSLRARLFPDEGQPSAVVGLVAGANGYAGTLQTATPSLSGHIQVWAEEPNAPGNQRPEIIIAYSIGGNPGYYRLGGSPIRGGSGYYRLGGAPLLSPDGQMLFFTRQAFAIGQFYAIQQMAALPELPSSLQAVGQGYRLVASPDTRIISGSVTFQYRGEDVLIAGLREEGLRVAFWNGTTWRLLDPSIQSTTYNMISAVAQGPGVYALIGGRSRPTIAAITPTELTTAVTTTLRLTGTNWLAPSVLVLTESTVSYTLAIDLLTSSTGQVTVPAGLQPGSYSATLINGDKERTSPLRLGLHPATHACFAEQFNSGLGNWQLDGPWAMTTLADGTRVLDDSPGQSYDQAVPPSTRLTTTITLRSPIDLSTCNNPVLHINHDYIFAPGNDHGLVEVSRDGGNTWQTIADFTDAARDVPTVAPLSSEWLDAHIQPQEISLTSYQTNRLHLRLRVVVDQRGSERGWIVDALTIQARSEQSLYLPITTR